MPPSLDRLAAGLRERRPLAWLAGGGCWLAYLVSLALGGWTHDARGHRLGADHVEYYVAGQFVNEGRPGDIYDLPTTDARQREVGGPGWPGPLPFRYPPFYALAFSPTSRLAYEASWAVWTALSLLALVAALAALEGRVYLPSLGAALCFAPVFAALSFGQNGLFSLAILAFAYALQRRGHRFAAGVVGGLLLYKPQLLAGVGLLWLLPAPRRWPSLLGMAVTGAALVGLAWVLIPDAIDAFFRATQANVNMYDRGAMAPLYSSQGFWLLLLPGWDGLAKGMSLATSSLAAVALGGLWWRCRDDNALFAAAVALTLLISPYAMEYDWSILLLPAVVLPRLLPAERSRWEAAFGLVWVAALVSAPLVTLQVRLSPLAVQAAVPALVAALALSWPALVARGRWSCRGSFGAGGATDERVVPGSES